MRILITTSLSLSYLDTASGEFYPLDRGRGLYYGIAHNAENIYVAARNRLVSSDVSPQEERGEILVFNRTLQLCEVLHAPFPLRDIHEIAWHGEKLWVTCSFNNMIAIFDGEHWESWFPLGVKTQEPYDENHFNSFLFESNRLWILAHNRGASELLAFSLPGRELVERIEIGHCGHNIWREGSQIFSCSSAEGVILGDQGFCFETGGFPRGVAVSGGIRCIGVSEIAERKDRDFTTGKVIVFTRDWKLINEIELHREGLILDIQPLPMGFSHKIQFKGRILSAWRKFFNLPLCMAS